MERTVDWLEAATVAAVVIGLFGVPMAVVLYDVYRRISARNRSNE